MPVTTRSKLRAEQSPKVITVDEFEKQVKNFLVAYMIFERRGRDSSPTRFIDLESIINFMRQVYNATAKVYAAQDRNGVAPEEIRKNILAIPADSVAEVKWREICFEIISKTHTSYWTPIRNVVVNAYNSIQYSNENPVESLMTDGHIRTQVLRHMTLVEIMKYMGELDNEKKLDILFVLNDPTSKAFKNLCDLSGSRGSRTFLKAALSMRAKPKGGKKWVSFNINTHDKSGRTIFMEAVYSGEREFVEYLLKNYDIDLTIRHRKSDGSVHNALSYAIYKRDRMMMNAVLNVADVPFFFDAKTQMYGREKDQVINNLWIVENMDDYPMLEKLVKSGLDIESSGDKAVPDVKRYLIGKRDELKEKIGSSSSESLDSYGSTYDDYPKDRGDRIRLSYLNVVLERWNKLRNVYATATATA